MRVLNERFTDRDVDLTDGIKVFDPRLEFRCFPTPTSRSSTSMPRARRSRVGGASAELRGIIEEIEQGEAATARTLAQV